MNRLSVSRLATITLVTTVLLIAFGGFTRGSGSGYGCADRWPLCEDGVLGGLLPGAEYHMIIEWTHRWIAAVVGVLAVLTALAAWAKMRRRGAVLVPAVATVVVIGIQAWIGRQVVVGDLEADLVSVHLAVSLVVVGLLAVLGVTAAQFEDPDTATEPRAPASDRGWTAALGAAALGIYVLVILGSYAHNLYVPGWPLVQNELVPDLPNRYFVAHFLHRLVAGVGFFALVWLAREVVRRHRSLAERSMVWASAAAFSINLGLGAAHVFTRVQSSALVATHLGLAAVVWVLLVAATTRSVVAPVTAGQQVRVRARASAGSP